MPTSTQEPGEAVQASPAVVQAPRTLQELRALEFRREGLKAEIASLIDRRGRLMQESLLARGPDGDGIRARMRETDQLMGRLERELDQTNARIAAAPARLVTAETQVDPARIAERITEEIVPIVGIVSLLVLAPIAFAIARLIWRRAMRSPQPVPPDASVLKRLEQLQHSMDAVAVEVERISESQRFLAKAMNEKQISAGPAQAVKVEQKAGVIAGRE